MKLSKQSPHFFRWLLERPPQFRELNPHGLLGIVLQNEEDPFIVRGSA